jgi:DNA-binding response OmpR family regulator
VDVPAALDRPRILVVDDSPTVLTQLANALDRLGLDAVTVASAQQARDELASGEFSLALVDVVMPDADGYQLTREIKKNKRLRGLPVIILTSRSSPFDLARGALAGCDAYLNKPVPFHALEEAMARQLRRTLAPQRIPAALQARQDGKGTQGLEKASSRLARLFGKS